MCLTVTLQGVCTHSKEVIHPCSNPILCQPLEEFTCIHKAECEDCLGIRWPMETYADHRRQPNSGQSPQKHGEIAEGLINWAVLWLADEYGTFHERDSDWEEKHLLTSTAYLMDHAIKTIFHETRCKTCNHTRQSFTFVRCDCPQEDFDKWNLANPVTIFRQRVARDVFNREVEQVLDSARYTDMVQRLAHAEALRPPRTTTDDIALPHPPMRAETARHRREEAFKQFVVLYDQAVDKTSFADYTFCAGAVVNVLALLMASDPGLAAIDIKPILKLLSSLLIHPEDTNVPDRRQLALLRPLQLVIDKFICSVKDSNQLMGWRYGSGAAKWVMDECCKNFITRFEGEESYQRQSCWATYVQSTQQLSQVRLKHYSVTVSPQTLDSEWICPICQENQTADLEVIRLRHCFHSYHFVCLLQNELVADFNPRVCGYCRTPWDIFPGNDQTIDNIDLEAARKKHFNLNILRTQIETPNGLYNIAMSLYPLLGEWLDKTRDCHGGPDDDNEYPGTFADD